MKKKQSTATTATTTYYDGFHLLYRIWGPTRKKHLSTARACCITTTGSLCGNTDDGDDENLVTDTANVVSMVGSCSRSTVQENARRGPATARIVRACQSWPLCLVAANYSQYSI